MLAVSSKFFNHMEAIWGLCDGKQCFFLNPLLLRLLIRDFFAGGRLGDPVQHNLRNFRIWSMNFLFLPVHLRKSERHWPAEKGSLVIARWWKCALRGPWQQEAAGSLVPRADNSSYNCSSQDRLETLAGENTPLCFLPYWFQIWCISLKKSIPSWFATVSL